MCVCVCVSVLSSFRCWQVLLLSGSRPSWHYILKLCWPSSSPKLNPHWYFRNIFITFSAHNFWRKCNWTCFLSWTTSCQESCTCRGGQTVLPHRYNKIVLTILTLYLSDVPVSVASSWFQPAKPSKHVENRTIRYW